jgi:hypothetical protein
MKDGTFTFNVSRVYLDTGTYMIWGPNVIGTAMEVSNGPYRFYAVDSEGFLVYTNNGVSSAFRRFFNLRSIGSILSSLEISSISDSMAKAPWGAPKPLKAEETPLFV